MKLIIVGINHQKCPLEIREKGAFIHRTTNEGIRELLQEESIEEVLILSTCNRSEIYVITKDEETSNEKLKQFYLEKKSSELAPYLFELKGREALIHLFRVVSGLDSMILGEDQILGQAKEALVRAQNTKGSRKYMTKIFREAITFTKKVKTQYKISETPISLSSTAVKLIKRRFPMDYEKKNIMIIGSGKMGNLALQYMKAEGFKNPFMTNRTFHHMDHCAHIHENVRILDYENRYALSTEMDVIISATTSPHLILRAEKMPERKKPLIIMDLALPRDIDEKIGELNQIELLTIDHFKERIDEKMDYRREIAEKISIEIEKEIDALFEWITNAKVDHMVKALNDRSWKIAEETIGILSQGLELEKKDANFLSKIVHSKFRQMVMPSIRQLKLLEKEEDILEIEKALGYLLKEKKSDTIKGDE
ncbi:MAG: glutamyl-tRNA reductase [Eubacteriaceae bacterium]